MTVRVLTGDCREVLAGLPEQHFHTCVTSPPYFGLRDYQVEGQLGLEPTPDVFVEALVAVFREVRRVLRDDGTVWLNLGDSYGATGGDTHSGFNERWSGTGGAGSKQDAMLDGVKERKISSGLRPKNLLGIPWRVAFALQADGWILRQDIIWHKPNPMPESVRDRCTKAHEYLFLLSKGPRYYWDREAMQEPAIIPGDHGFLRGPIEGCDSAMVTWRAKSQQKRKMAGVDSRTAGGDTRNRRSVWTVTTQPYSEAHFATFPPALVEPCIKAGCPVAGHVLDPFGGAGTTGLVADRLQRHATLIELSPVYAEMARERLAKDGGLFAEVAAE